MESEVIEKVEKSIKKIVDEGLTTNNLDTLYKLSKIKHMAKEDEQMNNYGNYGEYGNYNGRPGYDAYGRYNEGNYGRRGYDMKYRGEQELDRMAGEYGRYQENRGRYGAGSEETDKSFHYMVKALEDFIKVLEQEAETQQQKMQLKQALQEAMR